MPVLNPKQNIYTSEECLERAKGHQRYFKFCLTEGRKSIFYFFQYSVTRKIQNIVLFIFDRRPEIHFLFFSVFIFSGDRARVPLHVLETLKSSL